MTTALPCWAQGLAGKKAIVTGGSMGLGAVSFAPPRLWGWRGSVKF